jgi:hypothetical protein
MRFAHRENQLLHREHIDLGLAILQALAIPGVPLAQKDIAAWCQCSHTNIQRIERRALQKLRNRLTDEDLLLVRDFLARGRREASRATVKLGGGK